MLHDPVAKFDRERINTEVNDRFGKFLPSTTPDMHVGAIYPFAGEKPWRYWDTQTVETALNILEQDKERTIRAIKIRGDTLSRGMQNLFRPSPALYVETSIRSTISQGLVELATKFLPEYLRVAEHVFGNLLEVYWSVIKRKGVEGNFDLRGAIAVFQRENLEILLKGFHETVRNAIAHGNFVFTGFDIEFGIIAPETYTSSDFLRLLDDLWRTSNSLCIGLLLFWIRNNPWKDLQNEIPIAIIERFAAGGLNRIDLEILGIVESNTPLAGKQLHVAVRMSMKSRTQVFGECSRVAIHLLEAGAFEYDRFVIEIDHGEQINSMAMILPKKLMEIVENDLPLESLPEVFTDSQLLWFDESKLKVKLRLWRTLFVTGLKQTHLEILNAWRENGLWIGKGRFRIREVENTSSQGIARIRVRAVLKNPADSENINVVREVLYELAKYFRRRYIRSRESSLDSGLPWPKKPHYIFIDLFKVDGTLRWLRGGGWMGGNLVAVAEYVRGKHKPVLIDNPEEIYKGLHIRYTIDDAKAKKALHDLAKIMMDIHKKNK